MNKVRKERVQVILLEDVKAKSVLWEGIKEEKKGIYFTEWLRLMDTNLLPGEEDGSYMGKERK